MFVCFKKSVQIWKLYLDAGSETWKRIGDRFGLVGRAVSQTTGASKHHPIVLISLLRISAKTFLVAGLVLLLALPSVPLSIEHKSIQLLS